VLTPKCNFVPDRGIVFGDVETETIIGVAKLISGRCKGRLNVTTGPADGPKADIYQDSSGMITHE
jgi:hypothetical protein